MKGALFYSSMKCTGAPKYPYKDILVHPCTSPMNKTTHAELSYFLQFEAYMQYFVVCQWAVRVRQS